MSEHTLITVGNLLWKAHSRIPHRLFHRSGDEFWAASVGVGCATAGADEPTTIMKVSRLPPNTDIEIYLR
jgi:hypothetical protein